jgi:hypothetical protein
MKRRLTNTLYTCVGAKTPHLQTSSSLNQPALKVIPKKGNNSRPTKPIEKTHYIFMLHRNQQQGHKQILSNPRHLFDLA